ncbi:Cellobiose dehydrogenase [Lachnellula arida]|uniref:Cellobiose dehydrogenase n=1 Tax=Lachnellula arida TaxID=1316785 RepID=A0A8T9BHB9_9HELO|nr:Cellobiose dehydrogenase [Lachnellula arida]
MRSFLTSLAFIAGTYAQSSVYTDDNTGITFQRYANTEGVSFGIAVPETPASDFIGQMVAPSNGSGYAGVSLTPEMTGSLLVVAWPNNNSVVASFRETRSGYTSPGVYTASGLSLSPIANGTFVNSTHLAYTFLCTGCMGLDLSFAGNSTSITLGWALGTQAVTNPSSASTASFTYHDGGFGEFGLTLSSATSASYASWAAMASNETGSGDSTSNSTCTSTATNVTATVSNSTYDYIVAGAGPAGIIVAERLAESGKSVLLLERGQTSTYATGGRSTVAWNDTVTQYDVPSMSYYLTTASDTSEYCTDVASMAGCLLGGGTMVNALMFVRPQEADFNDKWPTGWKFPDVKASADRLYERNPGTTLSSVDRQRYDQSAWDILSPFFKSIGYREVDAIESPNEKTQVFSHPPWDIQGGLRAGPVKSYLPLAKAMSNFKLTLNTKVVRAVRNGSTISGVEVEDSAGSRQIINVNPGGKVILASGTMSTPRILYNSGIGPTDQITTVANGCTGVKLPSQADWINLPVGKNLRDHPIFTLTFNTTANATSMLSTDFLNPSTTDIDLFAKGSGALAQSGQRLNFWTSLNTTNGTRFFQGTCNSPAAGQVRIKLYLTHGATSSGVLGITSDGATEFTTNPWMNTDADKTAVITLIDSLLAAAKNSSSLTPSSTMSGASLVSNYITGDHFVGTAMMGTSNDGTAVVDTDTKVFGTDNLFVVDASIHPDLPTGNTQAIIMVVAEHAASKILALGSSASNSSRIAIPSKKSACSAAPTARSKRPSKRLQRF